MSHYNNLHDEIIERWMKCLQRKYNGYQFMNQCKNTARAFIERKHSYTEYSDINNDNSKDKDEAKSELKEFPNNLKDNIITHLKEEITKALKFETIKITIERKIKIDEVIKKTRGRCKTTTNHFYTNISICMKCKDMETKTCPTSKVNKFIRNFITNDLLV